MSWYMPSPQVFSPINFLSFLVFSQKTLAAASLSRPRPRPRFLPHCFCRRCASSPSNPSRRPWHSFSSSAWREATCWLLLAPLLPCRIHREEAPSSPLRCHHPEEWRLPLAHLLHPEERAVAIDGSRGRRRCAAGAGDLVQVVRGTLLPLVQKNGGRSSASGESCIDLVFCWAGEVVRRDARVLCPLPWPQHTQESIRILYLTVMMIRWIWTNHLIPCLAYLWATLLVFWTSSVERAAAGFFGWGPQVKHHRDVRRIPITLIILKLEVLRAMAASGNQEIQLGTAKNIYLRELLHEEADAIKIMPKAMLIPILNEWVYSIQSMSVAETMMVAW